MSKTDFLFHTFIIGAAEKKGFECLKKRKGGELKMKNSEIRRKELLDV